MAEHRSVLHVRVDDDTKALATLPLEMKAPNATTRAAMEEARAILATRCARFASAEALFADLEKNSRQ